MKLSLSWIKDYVKIPDDMDLKKLAYDLTMSTVEVEDVEYLARRFDNMVVGVIEKIEPHPNADKLRVCKVDIGGGDVKTIVCGGTTSNLVARVLDKPLIPTIEYFDPEIPPTAKIQGIDLVTEGVITIGHVLKLAKGYLENEDLSTAWAGKKDGASRIAQLLFEEATDIRFIVGRAINPAHQNPDLPISIVIKMGLIDELAEILRKMGKQVTVSYY